MAEISNLNDLAKMRENEHAEVCEKMRVGRAQHFEAAGKLKDIGDVIKTLEASIKETEGNLERLRSKLNNQ